MNVGIVHFSNIGLRHTFEDGISILSGEKLNPERQAYVIDDLWEIFQQAKMGLAFVNSCSLTYNANDMEAYQTFSLLARFLRSGNDPDWQDKISIVENVFDSLKRKNNISMENRATTIELLGYMVVSLKREGGIF